MLTTKIKDIEFKSPILTASGTFGYGHEVQDLTDGNMLGGVITKSITLHPREGNPPPRISETPSGMLNSIGLANVGVNEFCKLKLDYLNKLKTNVIINIAGSTIDEYIETLKIIENSDGNHIGYEINVSCPNVKEGGMAFGVKPEITEKLTKSLRKLTSKLLIVKLSPNVTKIEDIARASEQGGADSVSAINTVVGMGIDIKSCKPVLNTVFGGLSGPAIKPIALANVHKIYKSVKIPIIGIGGISTVEDIIEFILAGASLIQIGTLNFKEPNIGYSLRDELIEYCKTNNVLNLQDLCGGIDYL
ncbi:MAG: dihydroorotate dehydrogenase [Candidatus Marinimicrobia bacterium]|nr:dihydroorotate dehydrogenase [Candidatus Neomarinimicrobiota bacterium]MBL7022749.1 dihydroorotate dehydrogenase [Candidatus Neomarinimicrobiota bacterium]MBL7109613.1 dihydroorotate dehydrogenase [Candidatus Neomarinimicrobiota bacterium]